jgi:5-methylcytosine-specific restriction endonuclease McrA
MAKAASWETDIYDRITAEQFWNLARPEQQKRPPLSRKKRKELNRLISTQQAGRDAPKDWWNRYHQYTHSERWKRTKERIIRQRGRTCERCGNSNPFMSIHLHHLTYVRLGREYDEDFKLFCETCHALMHPGKQIARDK